MSRRVSARAWFYGPEGFGSTRGSVPTGTTVRKTDAAMALTAKGLCAECARRVNEDGECSPCKEAR